MNTRTKIVAIVVTTDIITLYKADGESFVVRQGDHQVPYIIKELVPAIREQGFTYYEPKEAIVYNAYAEYEKKSTLVKFFSIAKDKLAAIFSSSAPLEVGIIPTTEESLLEEVMANSDDTSSSTFGSDDNTTIVASVGGKLLPEVEKIEKYIHHANGSSVEGTDKLLERMANIERGHTTQELMDFLKAANMPIANDGSIIAYKNLKRKVDYFVDIHSGNIKQKVGWDVQVPENYVDPDRRRDCSQGLHIAACSYLRGFSGDTTVMVRIQPEDFIAVPVYGTNKARVRKYHIIAELSEEEADAVIHGDYNITKVKSGAALLAKAISNTDDVCVACTTISGPNGTNVATRVFPTIKGRVPLLATKNFKASVVEEQDESAPTTELVSPTTIEDYTNAEPKKKNESKSTQPSKLSNRQKIHHIINGKKPSELSKEDITLIKGLKKRSKKSYKVLGVPEEFRKLLM